MDRMRPERVVDELEHYRAPARDFEDRLGVVPGDRLAVHRPGHATHRRQPRHASHHPAAEHDLVALGALERRLSYNFV